MKQWLGGGMNNYRPAKLGDIWCPECAHAMTTICLPGHVQCWLDPNRSKRVWPDYTCDSAKESNHESR